MTLLTALATSVSIIAGILVWLFLGPIASSGLQIWAVFIGAGCFFHCGGKEAGLRTSAVNMIFGAFIGWVTLICIVHIPLASVIGLPVWAGIAVFIAVFILIEAANIPSFAAIPAGVYGFASIAGFSLLAAKLPHLLDGDLTNPFGLIIASLVIGALFGYVAEKIAGMLMAPARAAAA